jgi:hypothetical protein
MQTRILPTLILLLLGVAASAQERIQALGRTWEVPFAAEWAGSAEELKMLVARPQESPRYPVQYALLAGDEFGSFRLECEVKRESGSLILVYAWQGPKHFNYVHLSVDSPEKQPVHNGVFHVFGSDRSRISVTKGAGSLPTTDWTPVVLDYDAKTGVMKATVGGKEFPSLVAADLSLTRGRIGLGSFFETAQFRKLRITAK